MECAGARGFPPHPLDLALQLWPGVVCPGRGKGGGEATTESGRASWEIRDPLQIVGITAAFIFLLEPLGYLLASALFTFALFFLVSRYRMWIAAALAVTFGAGSWIFFTKVLSTPLPQGVLWMF